MNAITLRSGKELQGPTMSMREDKSEVQEEDSTKKDVSNQTPVRVLRVRR